MKTFSVTSALRYGWEKMKEEFSLVFQVGLIMWGIVLLSEGLFRFIDTQITSKDIYTGVVIFAVIMTLAISIVMQAGFYKIYLKLYDEEDADLTDLYSHYQISIKLVIASLLQGFIIFVGFLLLIVPGIIFALMFAFTKYIVVDTEMSPIESLKHSARVTKGARFQLLKLVLILAFLNIVGVLLIVGFLITIPVSMFAMIYAYRKLSLKTIN